MAFGKFLVGASKAMDLNPIVDIYADARRRREDRKQTIEDRDYQERLGLTTTATSLGLPVGDDATSGEIRSQIAGHFAPGAANKRALQTEADLGGYANTGELIAYKQKERAGKTPAQLAEIKRLKEAQDAELINTAANQGYDIGDGKGGVDKAKHQEMIADKARIRVATEAEARWRAAGLNPTQRSERKRFIDEDVPKILAELEFYTQMAVEDGMVDDVIPDIDEIMASIDRFKRGDSGEKSNAIYSKITKVRKGNSAGYIKWKEKARDQVAEEDSYQPPNISWGGTEINLGEGPLRPDPTPEQKKQRLEEWRSGDSATPVGEVTPSISSGETPGLGEAKPPTPAAPTPGATPPADPAYGALFDETHFGIEKMAGDPEGAAKAQATLERVIKLTPEELKSRYADTDLSLQERYYNPGSLRLNTVEEGRGFGWEGLVGIDKRGFAQFDSAEAGMNALKQQLRVDQGKTKKDGSPLTVRDFVRQYVGGIDPNKPNSEGSDPEGTKKALVNIPQILGVGLESPIKDIDRTALLRAVMTNENHTADSLSVFEPYIEEGRDLKSEVQSPGENPLMDQGGGLGETSPAKAVDVREMDQGALIDALDGGGLDWDTLSPEDKAWIQKNHPGVYEILGKK